MTDIMNIRAPSRQTSMHWLVEAFIDIGNPFLEDSDQLIELDGSVIM